MGVFFVGTVGITSKAKILVETGGDAVAFRGGEGSVSGGEGPVNPFGGGGSVLVGSGGSVGPVMVPDSWKVRV